MNTILFDHNREAFLPLTYTRPIADLRIGIVTIKEKWEHHFSSVSVKTEDYLSAKFPITLTAENLWINAQVLPNQDIVDEINALQKGEVLVKGDTPIAFISEKFDMGSLQEKESKRNFTLLYHIWEIFSQNGEEIKNDFERITKGRKSQELDKLSVKVGGYPLFIEEGAKVESAFLNCKKGPIYIGKDTEIMEGSMVRGPFAMCNDSVLKMGSKIYSNTTLGPFCKVGGEVNNVVFMGYSNKGHDGFLGNSVIGEWCNLGADSNNSNLKNNYAEVKLWNYITQKFVNTGLQFCGLIMGDHSKCGINSMFNTGTVVGVCANIFGAGFPRNFIPSFSWGGSAGFSTYKTEKAFEVAEIVMQRRNKSFDEQEENILSHIFELTKTYRKA
ncbi:MAG TPA: GlmU family protein [Flavobacteriales bacterium]|nr:GlmU family protein [Flavobacteriales bacterium]